jgi:hypothetical protein
MSLEAFVAEWMDGQPRSVGFYNSKLDEVPRRSTPCRYPHEVAREVEKSTLGVFLSVQPYTLSNEVAYLEKLFFDFDDKEKVSRAWGAALSFAENLVKFYDTSPLILFSGSKGYHVYVWLQQPYHADTQEHLKAVYVELMRMILEGISKQTFDPQVQGDIKRLSRVPYSRHQKTGELCVPVTADLKPYKLEPGFSEELRRHGLSSQVVEVAIRNLSKPKPRPRTYRGPWGRLRPCMAAVLDAKNIHDPKHLLKAAVVAELHAKDTPVEAIIDRFRGMDGFNEAKTRYFVEHSIKRGYRPYRCATIQKLGGCLSSCSRRKDPVPGGFDDFEKAEP